MATNRAKPKKRGSAKRTSAAGSKTKVNQKEHGELRGLAASYDTKPDVAVKVLLDEARDLVKTSSKDGAALLRGTDLSKGFGKELARRAALLDRSEDDWSADRALRVTTKVKKARADAEAVKRSALRALRYFQRADAEVQARVDAIAEGSGDADLIDDCNRLGTLVDEQSAALGKAKLGSNAGERLRAAAATLGDLTSEQASDTSAGDSINIRNRAFWYLRELMDEIRHAGRYVFGEDVRRLAKYRSTLTFARARRRTRTKPT